MQKKQITILVADNEIETANHFVNLFSNHPNVKQIFLADTVEIALYKIVSDLPDIIFMDFGKHGLDLVDLLRKKEFPCKIVITSNNENYAISAIQNNVYDFLLKPVKLDIVSALINRVLNSKEVRDEKTNKLQFKEEDSKIRLSSVSDYIFVDPKDIVYCESSGSYTKIYLDNGSTELVNYYLGKVSEKLSSARFFRISRFYLINLEKLLKVKKNGGICVLKAGKNKVTLSGTRKSLRNLCNLDF